MAVLPILAVLFAVTASAVLIAVLIALLVRRRPDGTPADGTPADDARRTAVLRWAGVTTGVLVAVVAARSGGLGMGLMLAAPLFGLCTLVGVLAGELTARPPRGPTRTATVEVRRIGDYLPRGLSRAVAATGAVLLVVLIATTAAGSPDDLGRAGRSLVRQCGAGSWQSHGPWPGSFYTGRLAVVVLAGLLLAYAALRAVVRRPRPGRTAGDDALRRRAARTVTGAAGILVALPLAGVGVTAAIGLFGISCAPAWWRLAGWALLAVVAGSLAMVGWCTAAVLTPAPRTPVRTR